MAPLRDILGERIVAPLRDILRSLEVPILAAVPAALLACAAARITQSALITAAVALGCIVVMFVGFDRSRPALRQIMPIVVISALAIVGRVLFAPFPYVKPVSALCILAGVVYGRRSGFMVGACAALGSNFFFGQGPWTPWQMYTWGLVGYLAGVLAQHGAFRHLWAVLVYGFVSGLLFGFVLNTWYVVGYVQPLTWAGTLTAYGAGLPFDITHGVATVAFLTLVYIPWKTKLERIQTKYALLPV